MNVLIAVGIWMTAISCILILVGVGLGDIVIVTAAGFYALISLIITLAAIW